MPRKAISGEAVNFPPFYLCTEGQTDRLKAIIPSQLMLKCSKNDIKIRDSFAPLIKFPNHLNDWAKTESLRLSCRCYRVLTASLQGHRVNE